MSLQLSFQLERSLYASVPLVQGYHSYDRTCRLLRVEPGEWHRPIECQLRTVLLVKAPPYIALSYAWVNKNSIADQAASSILCNGVGISISANLLAALRRLRRGGAAVDVWIDAICINQKDPGERSYQVSIMRDIYRMSEEVIIWLGESIDINDDLGADVMPMFTTNTVAESTLAYAPAFSFQMGWTGDERDREKWEAFIWKQENRKDPLGIITTRRDIFGAFCIIWLLSIGVDAADIVHLRHMSQSTGLINGLQGLMEQSWWQRIWVVQETVVASRATVCYANISAPWSMFTRAAIAYEKGRLAIDAESVYPYLQPLAKFSRIVTGMEGTRHIWNHPSRFTTLIPLLRMFRTRSATDARDKVYALLGLVQWWGAQQYQMQPDYSADEQQVFRQTAVTLIRSMRSLDVLAGTLGRRDGVGNIASHSNNCPSWVTDWAYAPDIHENVRVSNIREYDSAKEVPARDVSTHGQAILEIYGFAFDEIAAVLPALPLPAEDRGKKLLGEGLGAGWRGTVAEWEASLGNGNAAYVGRDTVEKAFWRTLCGDIEHRKDRTTGSSEFRRNGRDLAPMYTEWMSTNNKRKRATSIIGGVWQESGSGSRSTEEQDADTEEGGVGDRNAFHYAVECASGWRRFFRTRRGYMGTGPREIRAGDKVFIISGLRAPFALRRAPTVRCFREPVDLLIPGQSASTFIQAGPQSKGALSDGMSVCMKDHEECYTMVGDVYVQGIMDGEAASNFQSKWELFRATKPIILR